MGSIDGWDIALWSVVAYVALSALVRLMIRRRDLMLDGFRAKIKEEQARKEAAQREKQRRQRLQRGAA